MEARARRIEQIEAELLTQLQEEERAAEELAEKVRDAIRELDTAEAASQDATLGKARTLVSALDAKSAAAALKIIIEARGNCDEVEAWLNIKAAERTQYAGGAPSLPQPLMLPGTWHRARTAVTSTGTNRSPPLQFVGRTASSAPLGRTLHMTMRYCTKGWMLKPGSPYSDA